MSRGDPAQAQELYKSGMALYGKQRFEEALGAFDRAISLGDKSWKVLDAKAATMNRMGGAWRQPAFEVASGLCKKYGDKSHRPWYRAASILVALNMFDAAERSITKGLSLCKDPAGTKVLKDLQEQARRQRTEQVAQRQQNAQEAEAARIAAAKATMCFTHLLSPDVIELIAEHGVATDPEFALRMAGVCADWRSVVTARSALWSHVKLSRRRPLSKLALWAERSRGKIQSVTITNNARVEHHRDLATALLPYIPNVENLTLIGRIEYFTSQWRAKCKSLKSLVINNESAPILPFLFSLLHPDASSLRSVDISYTIIPAPHAPAAARTGYLSPGDVWLPNPKIQLSSLRRLRIRAGQVADPAMWLPSLLEHAPNVREVDLGCSWAAKYVPAASESGSEPEDSGPVTLESLTTLETRDSAGMRVPSESLLTPNLQTLSCYGWTPRDCCPIINLRGPGLLSALPILVSLDLGRCSIRQPDLLALLPELVSLKFLNVSFCGFDNAFLEELVTEEGGGGRTLLPSLTALSIAGHDSLSAGPLRRFILSRAPASTRPALSNGSAASGRGDAVTPAAPRSAFAPARRSAFGPTRPAQKVTASRSVTVSKSKSSTAIAAQSPAAQSPTPSPPVPATSTPAATPTFSPTSKTRMTWICIDACNHPDMDVRVLSSLRNSTRLGIHFLSNHNGPIVEDRIRGRGAYAWDLYDGAYAEGETSGARGASETRQKRGWAWLESDTGENGQTVEGKDGPTAIKRAAGENGRVGPARRRNGDS